MEVPFQYGRLVEAKSFIDRIDAIMSYWDQNLTKNMLFPNVFIGKIWRKSQKGVYLQRQKISKRCVIYQKLLFDKLEVNEG